MLLVLPLGIDRDRRVRPWIGLALLAASLVACFLETILPHLAEDFGQRFGHLYVQAKLLPGFFAIHQLWTNLLVHHSMAGLVIGVVAWILLVLPLERAVGHWRFLLVLAVLGPVVHLLPALAGLEPDSPGPALLAVLCGGLLFHLRAGERYELLAVVFLVYQLRLRRLGLRLQWCVGAVVFASLVRTVTVLRAVDRAEQPDVRDLRVLIISYLVALVVGYAAARLLVRRRSTARVTPLAELATAGGDLDRLAGLLRDEPAANLELLDRLADRCLAEQHLRAARVLADHLAARDPDGHTLARLRDFVTEDPP